MDGKYYILRSERVSLARLIFQQLTIENPSTGDRFFEAFGPGMPILEVSQPFERFHDYEQLLNILNSDNPNKYRELHKGTPFFFLGWAALDMRNYTKAVYYLDNAISEDMRSFPKSWRGTEGTNALKLIPNEHSPVYRVIKELREVLEEEVRRFNSGTNNSLEVKRFVENFIFDQFELKNGKSGRSIVTAFYTFIFEFQDRFKEVSLRSKLGGSVEPLLIHFFKGALIFESLLKYFYPTVTKGKSKIKPKTLRPIIESPELRQDYSITEKIDTSEITELKTILSSIIDSTVKTAFEVTFKIRNASGHNLVWDDIFDKQDNYKKIYEQIINAMLFIFVKNYS